MGGPIEESEESWHRVLDINLTGAFLTCKHVLPVMLRQGKGAIVNVSSLAAIRWLPRSQCPRPGRRWPSRRTSSTR